MKLLLDLQQLTSRSNIARWLICTQDRGFPSQEMRRERTGAPGGRAEWASYRGLAATDEQWALQSRQTCAKRVAYCFLLPSRAVEQPSPHRGTPVTSFTRLPLQACSSGGPPTRNPYFPRALRCLLPSTGRIFMLTSFQEKSLRANDAAIYYSAVYQFLIMWFSFNSSHLMQKEKGF